MNSYQKLGLTLPVVLCGLLLWIMFVGRPATGQTSQNCAISIDSNQIDQNIENNLMNLINNERSHPNLRRLSGANEAANAVAQWIASDSYTQSYTNPGDSERIVDLAGFDLGGCGMEALLLQHMPDLQMVFSTTSGDPIPPVFAIEVDDQNSVNNFINQLLDGNTFFTLLTEELTAEIGIGKATTSSGGDVIVFVWSYLYHAVPDNVIVPADPLYDQCGDAPTFDASNNVDPDAQNFRQNLINEVNNNLRNGNLFNQLDQEVATIIQSSAQFLAGDMAHDYYWAGGTELANRDENGFIEPGCSRTIFIDNYFPNDIVEFYPIPLDDNVSYGASYLYESLLLVPAYADALSDPKYSYMGVGYAKTPSGSERAVIVLAGEPISDPLAIPKGVVPTEIPPTATPPAEPISCEPSGGVGGWGITPGSTVTRTLSMDTDGDGANDLVVPLQIMVGDNYDESSPTLLTYFLHGDYGQHDKMTALYGNEELEDTVKDNGWIYVAPQMPEREPICLEIAADRAWHPWYGRIEEESCQYNLANPESIRNANILHTVLSTMKDQFNVCTNVFMGSAESGGSTFYDSLFLPSYIDTYPTYMQLHCGSGGIRDLNETGQYYRQNITKWIDTGLYTKIASVGWDEDLMNRVELSYVMDGNDDRFVLWPNIWYAIETYDRLDFNVKREVIPGTAHCEHDTALMTAQYWEEKAAFVDLPSTTIPAPLITPTDTPLPTATDTPLPTATDTPLPTATDTPLPTATDTPLPTATDTPLPTATDTPLPTATDTPLPTATDTPLPTATDTPLPTATDTPLPTATDTPLPTATDTPLPTATDTPLPTATDTPLPTATDTPLSTTDQDAINAQGTVDAQATADAENESDVPTIPLAVETNRVRVERNGTVFVMLFVLIVSSVVLGYGIVRQGRRHTE